MIGQTISHYRILEKLGEGGMGVVYKAEDTRLERTVALKFLSSSIGDDTAGKRFVQEARAASSLEHPNICTIHEIDETSDGRTFIVMPCYEGESLLARIDRGQMELDEAVSLAIQVCAGLSKAHDKGIVHRDVKPANLIVTGDGLLKIVDFGLAKLSGGSKLTRTGTTPGTVVYMSPEQLTGGDVDMRSDLWAVGIVLYEMITGETPFRGDHEPAMIYSIMNEEPKPVRNARPDVSADVERIIDKVLSKDPDERYQTSAELIDALESVRARDTQEIAIAGSDDTKPLPSIAVLPFANMSPDPENAYFADGLAEELINALTHLEGLRVAARTSAFRFRGGDIDIREIGRMLNVGTILEGSVRKAGTRLRVTAQLINIADGYHLWSERYDREMEDVFAIQDEITAAIVEQLKVKLVGVDSAPRVKRYTENLDAYSMYLKAQHHLFTLTPRGWQKSFELYQEAVQLDSSFALPYVSLSQIYQSQCFWGDSAPKDAIPKSRAAAEKALELDGEIASARAVLAVVYWVYDWDTGRAEREFKRAFELEPTEPFNHINYSMFLSTRGRFEEAVAESNLGRKLDPLSSTIASWAAIPLAAAGMHDDAIDCLQHAISLNPNDWQPYYHMSEVCLHLSRIDDARAACVKAVDLSGGASIALSMMAVVEYLSGEAKKSDELLEKLTQRSKQVYVAPSFFTAIHTARRERDIALKYLEKAVRVRDAWLVLSEIRPGQVRPTGPDVDAILAPVR